MLIYAVYLGARTYGFHYGSADALALGADFLAIGETDSTDKLWRALMARNRRGPHLPKTGIRDPGKQLDGPQHTLHVDGILLWVGYQSQTPALGETVDACADARPVLMGVGIFCFIGFAYALYTLGQGR